MQQKFEEVCALNKTAVFFEILRHMYILVVDVFDDQGSQKILEVGAPEK